MCAFHNDICINVIGVIISLSLLYQVCKGLDGPEIVFWFL